MSAENGNTRRIAFTFPVTLDGTAGELTVEAPTFDEVRKTLRAMRSHGIAPREKVEPFTIFPDGTAWCAKHEAVMSKRERQGDEWYSHNVGDKSRPCYCKGRPGKDSPGWNVGGAS